jgi:SPOR domain
MMKWLFWIVLLANLIFFSFIQWGELLIGENKDLKHKPPLNVEKIKLLGEPTAAPAPAPALSVPSAVLATSQDQQAFTDVCMEWGEFSGTDSVRATAALATLKLTDKLAQRQTEYAVGYWVYIPPAKNRAEMDKNIAELKAHDIKDYFTVQDAGKWKGAISLGVFKTDNAARKVFDTLRAKGVKNAAMGELMSKFKLTVFVLKSPDAATIEKMVTLQQEFAGSAVHLVACDKT